MTVRNWIISLGTVSLLLGVVSTIKAGEIQDSPEVSKLLSEAKTLAFQLKEDAGTMESFNRMDVSRESHALAINQIRDHVNALGKQVAKLQAAKNMGSPWQKTAIDRINPYLDELGGYTTAAIEYLSGGNHKPAEYKDYLEANADYASDLASLISEWVDYGKAKQRMANLGAKLEAPVSR